ncbi:hypothetical protein [Luteipulveratus halotolerans]|uniref:hypothetical protein n=1 Tax=Luteipulveratus halotolerans TaxID=1631356 RepID=UPI0012F8D487|nr:hypothetical protein [Luteipulveratus halotolerans]
MRAATFGHLNARRRSISTVRGRARPAYAESLLVMSTQQRFSRPWRRTVLVAHLLSVAA